MRKNVLLILFTFLLIGSSTAQTVDLFSYNGQYAAPSKGVVTGGNKLLLNRQVLQEVNASRPQEITISIPIEGEVLVLELTKANLFSYNRPDVVLASNLKQYHYNPGYYLRGKIRGKEHSLAAISIFENSAGGVLSFNGGNYTLCVANMTNDHSSNDYILYADKDYHAKLPECFVKEDEKPIAMPNYTQRPASTVGCPIDMYFELANELYLGEGSSIQNSLNYFTTLFNCVQTLYNAENILVQIREIKLWDIPDPEDALTTTSAVLYAFSTRMDLGFNGDLAHYVSFKGLGGGIAWRDQLCNNSKYYHTAVSASLSPNYTPFPNYSFSVDVITHETGHNIASPHTHSCTWPGGPIDNCYPVDAGPCTPGPTPPPGGGTVMSYCHLNFSIGKDFANGFGPLPGNLIRSAVTDATTFACICDCSNIALDITTQDIGCGNPTGSATAVITDGTGPFTYLWSNGSTNATATGLAAGTFYVTVKGSNGSCKVIKGCKIKNSGNALTVTTSPAATTVAKCIGESHPMTVTVSPGGTYGYQWYKDNVAINGATAAAYTAASTGVYYARINSSSCLGQSPSISVTVQNIPAFSITVNGNAAICTNDSVRLSIPSTTYSIEWSLNGVPIAGATSTGYYAKAAGNYTARLYSSTNINCSGISAAVVIQLKTLPVATIAPVAAISICKGEQTTISHIQVSGETYQWYNNAVALQGTGSSSLAVKTSGNYYLTVTNAAGCTSKSATIAVTVNPLPDSALTPVGPVALCDGGTIHLQVNAATSNATYQWYNGTQLINTGSSNNFPVSSSGVYSAAIKNNTTGCLSTSNSTIINIIPPPVIFAGNDTVLATGQPYVLHVREVSNLGVNQFDWTPTGLNNPHISNPTATLFKDQLYIVKGTHPLGCTAIDSVFIRVFKGPAIYVPTAFSPNGDGTHDRLNIVVVGLQSFQYLDIYNRFGERMFRTSSPTNGWDGTYKNVPVDPGTYVWVAAGVNYKGEPMVEKGTVVLVK